LNSKRTAPTHLSIPELVDCDECKGAGFFKGMFHEMPCDICDANGELHASTGEKISKETMIFVLRNRLKKKKLQLAWYAEKLPVKEQGHWDEFKKVNGGRQRFD